DAPATDKWVPACARTTGQGAATNIHGREEFMRSAYLIAAAAMVALAAPASAQLLSHKDLSLATALTIATTAAETCKAQGYRVSVTILGREGQVIVQLRGDEAPPHTIENSQKKAYTSRTFRIPSGEFVQRVKDNPTTGA